MSEQEFRVELAGNLIVYIPIKKQPEVLVIPLPPEFIDAWNSMILEIAAA